MNEATTTLTRAGLQVHVFAGCYLAALNDDVAVVSRACGLDGHVAAWFCPQRLPSGPPSSLRS